MPAEPVAVWVEMLRPPGAPSPPGLAHLPPLAQQVLSLCSLGPASSRNIPPWARLFFRRVKLYVKDDPDFLDE